MDSNLMSCPTCGHAVSSTAGACAYCGAIISKGGVKEQTEKKIAAEETRSTESRPAEQPPEVPPAAEISEDADRAQTATGKPSESIFSQKTPAEPNAADFAEPAAEAKPSDEDLGTEAEIKSEDASAEKKQAAAPDPEVVRQSPDSSSNPESALEEAAEPEAASLSEPMPAGNFMEKDETPAEVNKRSAASTHPAVEEQTEDESRSVEMPVSPTSEVSDLASGESDETETPGEEFSELIETQASEDKAQGSMATDERSSSDKTFGATQEDHADDRQPTEAQETAAEKKGGLISETLEETILLEPADEVKIPAETASDNGEERTKSETPKLMDAAKAASDTAAAEPKMQADVLKIEKAAKEMAAAIEKQKDKLSEVDNSTDKKAETAKAQTLKKQKAALEKAQAQKKQKLLLAKAAALKRKKAAEAKALALKKQRDATAGVQTTKIEKTAAAGSRREGAPTAIAHNVDVHSRMQDLLKKYEGQAIGINYDNSAEIREALLEKANSEYFSVFVKDKQLHYSYPLKTILTVIEGKDGVDTGNSKHPHKFNAVIKVYPLVLF